MSGCLEIKDGFGFFILVKLAKKQREGNRKGIIYLGALDTQHFALYLDENNNLVLEIFVLGVIHSVQISLAHYTTNWTVIYANLESKQNNNLLKLQIFNQEFGEKTVFMHVDIPQVPMPVGGAIGKFPGDESGAIMKVAEIAMYSLPLNTENIFVLNKYLSEKFALGLTEEWLSNPILLSQM